MSKILQLPTQLYYELNGVIADYTHNKVFDAVSLETVIKVRDHLLEWQRLLEEADQHRTGEMIMIPSSKKHAEQMLQVAEFYLKQYKAKE